MRFSIVLLMFFAVVLSAQSVNKEDIINAQKIMGLEFTDAERDSMTAELNDQLKNYTILRNINLKNSVMPSLLFNPLPAGLKMPTGESIYDFSGYERTEIAKTNNGLAWYTVGQLAALIKTKQITSVQLTKYFIDRLKRYDPLLHCVITITEERALREAALADKEIAEGKYRGMLHGIPYGIKDLLTTEDYKTTWGAEPYIDQMIPEDAAVVKKLKAAGAVLTAKLTMGALAWGDVWYGGKTRNPWDTSAGSSGSSAGSGSSVAAGLFPFAIGTETYGSIISPATICGISGLRPTYGRVSRTGAMALSWSMDKIGPLARSVDDLAIIFSVIYGPDGIDPTVYDAPFSYSSKADIKKLKVGYTKSDFGGEYGFKKFDSVLIHQLQAEGVELVPIDLPDFPVGDISFLLSAEAAAAFDDLTRSNKDDLLTRQIKNAWPNVFRAARFIPAVEYINANRARTLLIEEMAKVMKQVDVYLSPSWAGKNLLLTNLTGHPSVVIPNGFAQSGTPVSITVTGRLFEEQKILEFAKYVQNLNDFHRKHPQLFK